MILRFKITFKNEYERITNTVREQYFKVYAILSQLKYSFDELKAESVTGIWKN